MQKTTTASAPARNWFKASMRWERKFPIQPTVMRAMTWLWGLKQSTQEPSGSESTWSKSSSHHSLWLWLIRVCPLSTTINVHTVHALCHAVVCAGVAIDLQHCSGRCWKNLEQAHGKWAVEKETKETTIWRFLLFCFVLCFFTITVFLKLWFLFGSSSLYTGLIINMELHAVETVTDWDVSNVMLM